MKISKSQYRDIVAFVIEKLEGGYYHPQMLADGRVKDYRYSNSGETMFGIDRDAGGSLNTSTAGKKFWSIIDNANASNTWKWNYKGGKLEDELKELVADIMYPQYDKLSNLYLSEKARKKVDSDARLTFNFIYATWNGPGWFKKFASKVNEAVEQNPLISKDKLLVVALGARKESSNSLIRQTGTMIESFIEEVPGQNNYLKSFLIFGGIILIIGLGFYLYQKGILKKLF